MDFVCGKCVSVSGKHCSPFAVNDVYEKTPQDRDQHDQTICVGDRAGVNDQENAALFGVGRKALEVCSFRKLVNQGKTPKYELSNGRFGFSVRIIVFPLHRFFKCPYLMSTLYMGKINKT